MSDSRLRGTSKLLALVAILGALGAGMALERSGAIGNEPRKEVDPAAVRHAETLSDAFHNAADLAMPSVVTIRSKTKVRAVANNTPKGQRAPRGENPFKGTPFEDLFKGRGMEEFGMPEMSPHGNMPRQGMGSGVIIDSAGLVLTNNHVVNGADEVIVQLADGREFKADDIRTDEQTDLAVLRITGAGSLPAAPLGDSEKLRIGDWVIAIGNPFEYEQTVSAGIISGMGREVGNNRVKFLQTDAAINPGNSGGPLINLHGEVVGINTAIATTNGGFNGIGFAVPANLAKWVTGQLIKQGSVQRAYLGLQLDDMNGEMAEKLGGTRGEGVLVTQVFPNTPAAKAGLETGDIVTKFAGQRVKSRPELQGIVERLPVDEAQAVEILRDGKRLSLNVTPAAMPKTFGSVDRKAVPSQPKEDEPATYEAEELGLEVAELSAAKAAQLGYEAESGLLITQADPAKLGFDKGLREGMLVMRVGKKPVKTVEEFVTAMKSESLKDGVLLLVRVPTGANRFVLLKE